MYRSMKEFKPVWVKALRDGEYRQGKESLCKQGKKSDSFCCLGVAFDLLVQAGHGEWLPIPDRDGDLLAFYRGQTSSAILGEVAPAWLERWLYTLDDGITRESLLVHMNDSGKRFSTIANWIEKEKA